MTNLTRWEPVREFVSLREAMDRLLDDAFTHPVGLDGVTALPAIDLYETDNDVVVKAVLPGLKAEDVQISVTGDVLTLRGEVKQESERKDATYHIREQRYGSFERSVRLPSNVVTGQAKAEFENGILTVTLPKSEEVKPRTITIKPK